MSAASTTELIERKIDRPTTNSMSVAGRDLGVVKFSNMGELMEFAKMMSIAGTAVPPHLRNNPGACLAICIQAVEWRMSPFAVAGKSYVVNDRVGWESQLVHAVIEQRAPITSRIRHSFAGEGNNRTCKVWATLHGESEPLELTSPPFGTIQPKNSPLWKSKPDVQLYYSTVRDFCRVYFPDVLLGVYSEDELVDHTQQVATVSDKLSAFEAKLVESVNNFEATKQANQAPVVADQVTAEHVDDEGEIHDTPVVIDPVAATPEEVAEANLSDFTEPPKQTAYSGRKSK